MTDGAPSDQEVLDGIIKCLDQLEKEAEGADLEQLARLIRQAREEAKKSR